MARRDGPLVNNQVKWVYEIRNNKKMQNHFHLVLAAIAVSITTGQVNEGDECVFDYTNSIGRCTKVEDCESAKRNSELNGIKPTFCESYNPFESALVCCTDGNTILEAATPRPTVTTSVPLVWTPSDQESKRISEIKCEEYSQLVMETVGFVPLQTGDDEHGWTYQTTKCNYNPLELIIGGSNASFGEFPHMAAIGYTNYIVGYSFLCAGTLISDRYVLTAAHCSRSPESRNPEPVIVRLGDHSLDPRVQDGATPIDVPIRRIYIHPKYKSPIVYHDIALLELTRRVLFSSTVRPACLWSRDGFGDYSKAIATGWGVINTRRAGERSKVLKKVSLNLFENAFCAKLLVNNRNWDGFIDSQMCAGDLAGGSDTCQGDSGGPLQVTSLDNRCIFYIMGITSLGRNCGEVDTPAIYTRVSAYIDWIESIVWTNE